MAAHGFRQTGSDLVRHFGISYLFQDIGQGIGAAVHQGAFCGGVTRQPLEPMAGVGAMPPIGTLLLEFAEQSPGLFQVVALDSDQRQALTRLVQQHPGPQGSLTSMRAN
jgi:hypothetical protein